MKNRILRSALSVALCAAMLLSQGLTVFADGEIDLAAAKSSPVQESSEESEAKTPTETLTPETKKELPASTEDETKTETTTGQPTAEDDTAKETTAKTPAVVNEEEKSEEATAAPAEAQAATNSLKGWGDCDKPSNQPTKEDFDNLIRQITVSISCKDETSHSTNWWNPYQLKDGDYDGPEETGTNKYTITINSDHIAQNYVVDGVSHKLHGTQDKATITATWERKFIGWYEWKITPAHININVECDKGCHPDPIPEPSEEDIAAQLEYKLTCTNEDFSDEHSMPESNLLAQYISNIDWNRNETNATATIDVDQILDTYKFNDTHKLVSLNPMKVSLEYENNQWGLAASQDNVLDIKVICTKVPATPIEPGEINEEVLKAIIDVKMKCTNQYHEDSNFDVPDENLKFEVGEITGEKGTYSFNVTLDPNDYLALYNEEHEEHSLVDKDKKEIVINFTLADGKVTPSQKQVIIEVTCNATKPIPSPSESDVIAALPYFSFKCENSNCNASESIERNDLVFTIGKVHGAADTVNITFDNTAFSTSLAKFNKKYGKHNLAKEQPIVVTLTWNAETDSWYYAGEERDIIVPVECSFPSKDNFISFIEQRVNVQIECVNENRLHNSETITWPLEEGSYSRGYWKIDDVVANEQDGYTATITVDPSYCLDAYNKDNGEHYLVLHNSILSLAFNFNAASETWEPVEQHDFYLPVTCNVPAVPTYKDLEELLGNMTVHCVNTNHNATETYGITWDSIGGLNKAPTDNGDGTYSLEITVSHDTYLKLFNQTYPNHKWATDDDMENEKVTLIWKDGEWSVEGKTDFSFNVDCNATAPGGDENPDNPGGGDNGNNGGNNNGGSTGGGSSVSRRDDDDDWEPLPNNNYRVTKKNDKPSQNTQIVVRDPADNSDNTSSNTGSDSGKHNPETGDTTTVFAAMALAAVSLGGVVLLGRKKK